MNSRSFQSNAQEVLLTTIHNQDSVVEVYLNNQKNIITELFHLTDQKVQLYQYDFDKYKERPGIFEIFENL